MVDKYRIDRRLDGRFVICSPSGDVLDDAQGWGYTSKQKAVKAAWYKFDGGKKKVDESKRKAEEFWRSNKEFARSVNDFFETWFKEISRGEMDADEEVVSLAREQGVDGFSVKYLDYL